MRPILHNCKAFLKAEAVLCIVALAAISTMFFVPPSWLYIEYMDFKVLALLFCLMAVVAGLTHTGIFLYLSDQLLKKVVGVRTLSFVLVLLCFATSMWITNDVALITFVPFAIMVLKLAGQEKYTIKVVVLQTIAANLGSMLTPVGNPQNLYLYSFYQIPLHRFIAITAPYTIVSLALLLLFILFIKKEPLRLNVPEDVTIDKNKMKLILMYCLLFLLCIACVLHWLDYRVLFIIIVAMMLLFNRKIFLEIDYSLLLTFVCFFLFVGNIGSIPFIKDTLVRILADRTFPISIIASQVISNVPAAVLLSSFTQDYKALILGTDLGGLGTLIASLASLISFKLYSRSEGANTRKYLIEFTFYNLIFLMVLCIFYILC
jgi:Na+/H+ antiporter NhaD/arsenite permease-like protein